MTQEELLEIVSRRRRRYRRPLVGLQIVCVLVLGVLAVACIALPVNPNVGVVEQVITITVVVGGCGLMYLVIAGPVGADVAITDRQLEDIRSGNCLADWQIPNAGPGSPRSVTIGYCGLIYDDHYTPWLGAWDFSLHQVDFDDRASRLNFQFAFQSKAGVGRTKSIAVPVPKEKHARAREIVTQFQQALDSEEPTEVALRAIPLAAPKRSGRYLGTRQGPHSLRYKAIEWSA